MKKTLAVLSSLAFLTACKMQQDPLAGAPDAIREGRLPNTGKPVQTKPLPKEALQIDAPSLVNGRVGSQMEFNITGRVMTPNMPFQISIDNMSDFPGATFDAIKGEFKWVPLKSLMGGYPSVEIPLRITMATVATRDNPTISVEKKTISLVIVNVYAKPIVNSVTGSSLVQTGGRHVFNFKLEDIDAIGASDVTVNVRDCTTSYGSNSIAHLVDLRRIESDRTASNKYVGEAVLDLTGAENLRSGTYCFGLVAASKYGVVSDLYKKEVTVEAKMKSTRMTMEETPNMLVGQQIQIAFAIYDPSGDGILNVKSMDDIAQILPGSTLACTHDWSARHKLDCGGYIDTTTASPKTYVVNFVIENSGARTTQKTITNHTLRINVKAVTP